MLHFLRCAEPPAGGCWRATHHGAPYLRVCNDLCESLCESTRPHGQAPTVPEIGWCSLLVKSTARGCQHTGLCVRRTGGTIPVTATRQSISRVMRASSAIHPLAHTGQLRCGPDMWEGYGHVRATGIRVVGRGVRRKAAAQLGLGQHVSTASASPPWAGEAGWEGSLQVCECIALCVKTPLSVESVTQQQRSDWAQAQRSVARVYAVVGDNVGDDQTDGPDLLSFCTRRAPPTRT